MDESPFDGEEGEIPGDAVAVAVAALVGLLLDDKLLH